MALTGLTEVQFTNLNVTGVATFAQNVGIAGTLTYEDVTNIDAVGLITARTGIKVLGGGTDVLDGRVKIGTTSNTPASANEPGIVFGDNTAGTATKGIASFCANGAAPLLLTRRVSDGNVLGIADDTTTRGMLRVTSNDLEITAVEELRLSTGAGHNEKVRLTNAGNFGIGISSPLSALHVRSSSGTQAVFESTGSDNASISFKDSTTSDSIIVGALNNDLQIRCDPGNIVFKLANNNEKLRIGSSGQLGISGANYGTSGQVLTSQGNSSSVQWATPSSGLAMADMWRLTTTYNIPTNSTSILSTADWERPDQTDGFAQLGTGMSVNSSDHAAGVWTFPSTGFYLVTYNGIVYNGSNDPYEVLIRMEFCENGSTFNIQSRCFGGGERGNYNPITGQGLVDVTDTSNVKMRLRVYSANSSSTLQGNSNENRNYFTVIRLGDT